jgi:hypothetical protein
MPRIPLLGGSYSSKSLIASAQRAFNVFPENNPQWASAPVQVTHYPRAGRTLKGTAPSQGRGRCLYGATNGDLYAVIDQSVYYINPDWVFTLLGALVTPSTNPVYMADNGTDIVIVDGSPQGYDINMAGRTMTQIGDPNFLGADRVDYLDSFFVLNQPGTPNWYCSLSNQVVFNALDFGTKTAWPDNIVSICAIERQAAIFGPKKGELWANAGTSPFPFGILPGNIVEQGCAAKYSVAKMDTFVYWVSQSPEGDRMAVKSAGSTNAAVRISTFAIEAEWKKYARVDDAIGQTFLLEGHAFYSLHFPTADKTWTWDEATQQWHEEGYIDINGAQHRMRDPFSAFAYGTNVSLDFSNGNLYAIDPTNFTDNGAPILCLRSLPHVVSGDDERVTYWECMADFECGTTPNTVQVAQTESPWSLGFSAGFGPKVLIEPPLVSLRVSRTRGFSYGNAVMQPLGAMGQFNKLPTWRRLGYGRDLVLELSWSSPLKTALQSVWLKIEPHDNDMNG